MFGSYLYNCWAALIGFSVYFFTTFQEAIFPFKIIVGSCIVAIVAFFAMYLIRLLIGYILYTPEEKVLEQLKAHNHSVDEMIDDLNDHMMKPQNHSNIEFQDESPEEIAKVVRTMLNQENKVSTN